MRQAGILAAAGLIALDEMPARLTEDHANARILAQAIAGLPAVELDLATVQTNIVIFRLAAGGDAAACCDALKQLGVLASPTGPRTVRFVTHLDVTRAECEQAAGIARNLLLAWN
jgi:threonine aldolase